MPVNLLLENTRKILFFLILLELVLGGGGRLTAFGPVSLRMILFSLALTSSVIQLLRGERLSKSYVMLLIFFLATITLGTVTASINQNNLKFIWEDVKPLSFFVILPFFSMALHPKEIDLVGKIIGYGALILSITFLVSLLIIHSGIVPFMKFYHATSKTEEFFYRGELTYFYKGFVFLGIGCIYFFFDKNKFKWVFISILLLSIIVCATRGLLFALAGTAALYLFAEKKYIPAIGGFLILLTVVGWGNKLTSSISRAIDSKKNNTSFEQANPTLLGDRNYSDSGRIAQFHEVKERVSFVSAFIGHGFGSGIPSRPIHMEISYLEIFHKQGIIGLSFWFMILFFVFKKYRQANPSPLAHFFFHATIFLYLQSLTNQYINNPIGLSVLLLAFIGLDKLKEKES